MSLSKMRIKELLDEFDQVLENNDLERAKIIISLLKGYGYEKWKELKQRIQN